MSYNVYDCVATGGTTSPFSESVLAQPAQGNCTVSGTSVTATSGKFNQYMTVINIGGVSYGFTYVSDTTGTLSTSGASSGAWNTSPAGTLTVSGLTGVTATAGVFHPNMTSIVIGSVTYGFTYLTYDTGTLGSSATNGTGQAWSTSYYQDPSLAALSRCVEDAGTGAAGTSVNLINTVTLDVSSGSNPLTTYTTTTASTSTTTSYNDVVVSNDQSPRLSIDIAIEGAISNHGGISAVVLRTITTSRSVVRAN
jgi:hypothetical protein